MVTVPVENVDQEELRGEEREELVSIMPPRRSHEVLLKETLFAFNSCHTLTPTPSCPAADARPVAPTPPIPSFLIHG